MAELKAELASQRDQLEQARLTLHQSRAEPSGLALSKLLTILSERSVARLLTATDIGDVRAAQGEVAAYQRLLDFQNRSPLSPQ